MKQWSIFLMLGLFVLVLSSFDSADAAYSEVMITTEQSSGDVLEGDAIMFTFTLVNDDMRYRYQEVYFVANWVTGVTWNSIFVDSNGDALEENIIRIYKQDQSTISLIIYCDEICSAGDTNTVQIYGKTDPRFYNNGGNVTDTCGSTDCRNDTSPPSSSSNLTNIVTMTLKAWTEYESEVKCANVSNTGDGEVYPSNPIVCNYTLTNLGWNTDTYQFTSTLTSPSGQKFVNLQNDITGYWPVSLGMADGKVLTGHSNMSVNATHSAEGIVSIIYPNNATAGVYNFEFGVTSTNETRTTNYSFNFTIPESDEEVIEDSANETAEEENEEVPALSLIPVVISIGLIAVFRRK